MLAPKRRARVLAAATTLGIALAATTARATQPPPHELEHTSSAFLGLELLGALAVFAAYSAATGDPAERCGWCETNSFDRSARRLLLWDDPKLAGTLSHVGSLGATPALAFAGLLAPSLGAGRGDHAVEDVWIVFNAFALTTGLADGTKKLTDRARPAFAYGRERSTEGGGRDVEANLSFFSGDTAWAFAIGSSATTLAYLRGYETAPWIAAGTGALALTTGLLRIAADMHWATDVMAGAAVGTAVGVSLPLLLHPRARADGAAVTVAPTRSAGGWGATATLPL